MARRIIDPLAAPRYVGAQIIINDTSMLQATREQMDEVIALKLRAAELTLRHTIDEWVARYTEEESSGREGGSK